MVLAYHITFGCYGFWLPNDPRGSGSDFVRNPALLPYGPATKVHTRRSRAAVAHDPRVRTLAKAALERPPLRLTGRQAREVGKAFASYAQRSTLVIHACAIMPDHVHLVIARHRLAIEQVVNLLKGNASRVLVASGVHPYAAEGDGHRPSIWAENSGWKVFLNTPQEIRSRIDYVENNPVKAGLSRQQWKFVQAYEG